MTIFLFYFLFLFFRFAPYIIFDFVRYMLICSVCSYFHIFFGFNLVLLKSNLMSNISVYNLIWRISSKLLQYVYIFHCEIDLLFLRNIFFFWLFGVRSCISIHEKGNIFPVLMLIFYTLLFYVLADLKKNFTVVLHHLLW